MKILVQNHLSQMKYLMKLQILVLNIILIRLAVLNIMAMWKLQTQELTIFILMMLHLI